MSLKKNILANYLGQIWTGLMGIAFLPLYIKYLGVESYGLIGVFAVMQGWLTLLDMGMTPTLNREMARFTAGIHSPQSIRNLLRSLEMLCFGIAMLISVAVWAASGWLASDWLKVEKMPVADVAQAVSIMSFVVGLRFIEGIYHGSLFGLQRQVWFSFVSATLATVRSGGAVLLLLYVAPTIQVFFLWQAFISLCSVVVYASKVHRILPKALDRATFSSEALLGVWRFAGGMMSITFLAILLTQVDKLLLSRLLTLESFGYYTLAATVTTLLYMVVNPITNAIYPRMVELVSQKEMSKLIVTYHQGAQLVTVLTAPIVTLLFFYAQGILFMWSGNPQLASNTAPILSILAIGSFLNGLMYIPYQLQLAHGWTSLAVKTNTVAVVILVPAILWGVSQYGAIGAAWVWVLLNIGYLLIAVQFMYRRYISQEKLRWYFADILMPTAGAIFVVWFGQQFQPDLYQSRWQWFLFLLITGCLALFFSAMLGNLTRVQLLKVLRK